MVTCQKTLLDLLFFFFVGASLSRQACLDDLPEKQRLDIIKLCDPDDLHALSCVSKEMKRLCIPHLKADALIGHTPAVIPAVKRCFITDNVICFQQVLQYFRDKGKVKKRHLAQLPALAAQLGAIKIFEHIYHHFLEEPSHEYGDSLWNKWMTRAALRDQWTFVERFHGKEKIPPYIQSMFQNQTTKGWLLQNDARRRLMLYSIPTLSPIKYHPNFISTFQKLRLILPKSPRSWFARSLVSDQDILLPSVKHIWSVLAFGDPDKKKEKLEQLKQRIATILETGVYLMDDILPDPEIIIFLWLDLYQNDVDSPVNHFLRFLLDEGAPIHDKSLILTPLRILGPVSRIPMVVRRSTRKMAIKYTSGSGTIALANELHYRTSVVSNYEFNRFVESYVKVTRADIFDPLVLRELVPYLTKFTMDFETIQYVVNRGLNETHFHEMYRRLPTSKNQERYKQTIDFLSKMVQVKRARKGAIGNILNSAERLGQNTIIRWKLYRPPQPL